MSQIKRKFLEDNIINKAKIDDDAVGAAEVKLENNLALRARNAADSADVDLMKLDGSNKLQLLVMPEVSADASSANQLVRKSQLDGVETALDSRLDAIEGDYGVANGLATLDGAGKVPVSQLPNSIMQYQGMWNASTNSPSLADGAGNADENIGSVYRVSVAGTQNLGSGSIAFDVGDYAILNASKVWEKADMTDQVSSVNGEQGAVILTAGDIDLDTAINGQTEVQGALADHELRIDALELASVEFVQEKFILGAGDITNGYVTLANLAISASVNAFVDRLAIHATDDYTLSTVGGVTRMTFAGSLITVGQEKLTAGDIVRVKYAKKPL